MQIGRIKMLITTTLKPLPPLRGCGCEFQPTTLYIMVYDLYYQRILEVQTCFGIDLCISVEVSYICVVTK